MTQQTKILDYVPQPDALTCQSAAISRVIGSQAVRQVRADLLKIGPPGAPWTMGEYLRPRVKDYQYDGNASLDSAIEALKNGYHLITHGWFTSSGHVIGISGWDHDSQRFTAEDPWFEFDFPGWTYYPWTYCGDDIPYSARGIWAACVAGQSVWHSHRIYLDTPRLSAAQFAQRGMWLHMVKN